MSLFHAALLRDLARTVTLLSIPAGISRNRAHRLGRHLGWLVDALRIHHQGEDDVLWPLLAQRDPTCQKLISEMLDEHHSIDEPLHSLEQAANRLAQANSTDLPALGQEALRAVESLTPSLTAHLQHEEQAALPCVTRLLTQTEWQDFEHLAWASKRTLLGSLRLVLWMLDGLEWTPELRTRFRPAQRVPHAGLQLVSRISRIPSATPWSGTPATSQRPHLATPPTCAI